MVGWGEPHVNIYMGKGSLKGARHIFISISIFRCQAHFHSFIPILC